MNFGRQILTMAGMGRFVWLLATVASVAQCPREIKLEPGEYWWGGKTVDEPLCRSTRQRGSPETFSATTARIAQGLLGYAATCPDLIGGGEFTSFLPGSKLDEELIVRSAQVHVLMPMMQFSAVTGPTTQEIDVPLERLRWFRRSKISHLDLR